MGSYLMAKRDVIVWLVDDVESVRKSIRAVLETADITIRDYGSAKAFLKEYQSDSAGCLVVDQHMPDMSGVELLEHLASRGITPPAIIFTGQGSAALRAKALKAGAIAMLDKPVDAQELIELIEANFPPSDRRAAHLAT